MTESNRLETEPLQAFEWTSPDGPSSALIMALSTVLEVDPLSMEPLYEAVDPEALDSLFSPTQYPYERLTGSVQFEYHGYWVNINATGRGCIYEQDEGSRPSAKATYTAVEASDD